MLALQPLDVVKTRLQGDIVLNLWLVSEISIVSDSPCTAASAVQDGVPGPLSAYKGTVHALKSIVREEGWRALYSGLAPGLLGAGDNAANFLLWSA